MKKQKYVYLFSEADASMRDLLGGKGANLAEMTKIGLPVPQGFTVTTEACNKYYEDGKKITDDLVDEVYLAVEKLEQQLGKKFGDARNPLLLSVRSGSRASMPGMMDTILNLGINLQVVEGLARLTGNERFAYDSYRRFIQMYADVVMDLPKSRFEVLIDELKEEKGVKLDSELSAEDLKQLVQHFLAFYKEQLGSDFPQDPKEQLIEATKAVFRSWENPRAEVYRRMHNIPASWGTAVNIQAMVFGNMGNESGTGVAFSRNPSTGENKLYGEYLMNAQGEDVVAGIRTPLEICELEKQNKKLYDEFVAITHKLEQHYHDMQDMEFTIENGKLYMLQTRNGKRTASAALQIAVDMVNEKMLTKQEALLKIDPKQLDALLHPTFKADALAKATVIAKGLPASPGAGSGKIAFTADQAVAFKTSNQKCILVRLETSPEDIEGMAASQGVLTARGGMTSHAAVVARGMGTACVAGCHDLSFDEKTKTCRIGNHVYHEGDIISIDGSTGSIYGEAVPTETPTLSGNFGTIMQWADDFSALKVRTNADTPKDAKTAYDFGAQGIGLCRTEHMFFEAERISAMREMIVSSTLEERKAALSKLLPMQRKDFVGLYQEMKGYPVTIRFLDPPLHEFLPHTDAEIKALATEMGLTFEMLKATVESLHEFNPMLGHRGLRLAVTYPEIAEMQTQAVIEAALIVKQQNGYDVKPEIMIPLTSDTKEFAYVHAIVKRVADQLIAESGISLDYTIGTMIETPRACVIADKLAQKAEFFSFGTNDLTQMSYGFSRDDAGKFLNDYYDKKIFESDPFARLDAEGVGALVAMACTKAKQTNPNIKLGICGEHGGEPSSIEFCHNAGLGYVSCSPYRVPIARLAAAQANLKFPRK